MGCFGLEGAESHSVTDRTQPHLPETAQRRAGTPVRSPRATTSVIVMEVSAAAKARKNVQYQPDKADKPKRHHKQKRANLPRWAPLVSRHRGTRLLAFTLGSVALTLRGTDCGRVHQPPGVLFDAVGFRARILRVAAGA
ncbi:hypothetical protein AN403_3028 [Pseudomonas fluorescens]|uniref:Uncharacterized protein n=1 Tax=Pseudomonas fluorescens TaxID=294 RepID=A0A0N8NX80_PSEFL|nr:hypothetical protein AN403_3028 [Pseudomonas fluorescens]